MYDLGTPLSTLGWALPSFQAKNQHVVVPLLRYTMHFLPMLFLHTLWDIMGYEISLTS